MLIALGLEGLVEWSHHRHLRHEAHDTIRTEIENNRQAAAKDALWLSEYEQRIQQDIKTLLLIRGGQKLEHGSLTYHVSWSSFSDSAWKTAHSSGAINYFDYADAQQLSDIYTQQDFVETSALQAYAAQAKSVAPLFISGDPNKMTKEEVQLCLQRSADLLLDIKSLEQILGELQREYDEGLKH